MDNASLTALGAVLAILLGGGGVTAAIKVFTDRKAGVKGEERETRRDMVADRDGLIETLLSRTSSLEERVTKTEKANDYLRGVNHLLSDHIDILEAFAWALGRGDEKLPPPPRPRIPPLHRERGPENG